MLNRHNWHGFLWHPMVQSIPRYLCSLTIISGVPFIYIFSCMHGDGNGNKGPGKLAILFCSTGSQYLGHWLAACWLVLSEHLTAIQQ